MATSSRRTSRSQTATRKQVAGPVDSWLTAAERKLLDGTVGRSLAEATRLQLQATMTRARRLRDKWRDLFNRQMQATKRAAPGASQANSRSLDKAELFAAAVRRVEARLVDLAGGDEPTTTRARKTKSKAAAPKKARSPGRKKAARSR